MTRPAREREFMPVISDDLPPGERPMVAVVRATPGHAEQLAAAIAKLTAAVRQEPGCREFRAFRAAAEPGVFYLYEIYDDTEAFRTHLSTDHVAHFFTELAAHSLTDAAGLTQLIELPSL
ncbi:MAG TPA: putative quinol monooxygenase [Jatrophihabitantaceae bacterium]|jgi:quinol monooxygenase YgiN|nr:putative quinol monooxygenase [Jatrophihabitantaceae bacterium]